MERDLINHKSQLGHRALARVPRTHRKPAWFTTPPIATEEPMGQQQQNEHPDTLASMRRVMRELVALMASKPQDEIAAAKQKSSIESLDDARLAAVATEALANLTRAKKYYDNVENELGGLRKELDRIRAEIKIDERAVVEAQKAIRERDDIAAKYKELQKQLDPEKQQLELMYAIDKATEELKVESGALRRELGQRQTEVNELKASKKRLREALDRLAGKD